MNKNLVIALAAGSMLLCCSCRSENPTPQEPEVFTATSWNGEFLQAISDAYDEFVKTDEMPSMVNVEGINYTRSDCFSAAVGLLELIEAYPDTWQEQSEVEIPKYAGGSVMQNNTFEQDSISLDAVKWMIGKVKDYAAEHNAYPNYCNFGTRTWKSDFSGESTVEYNYSEEYVGKLIFPAAVVIMARIMNYYRNNLVLPDKVSAWWSDFLRSSSNCPIDDPLVVSTMQTATEGLTTNHDKAVAIFEYARDKWEWEDYSNTRKGAVGTIEALGGNCCDLSHAIVAMSRAAGIPARYIHGQCYFSGGRVIGHVISEIYVDGQWVICDASNNSATFGTPTWKGMQTFNGLYSSLPF